MKTFLWYWPFASTLLLFMAFACIAVIALLDRTAKLERRKVLRLTAVCFGSLAFHYLWGCILAVRSTFDYRIFPPSVTRVLYIVEVFAVLIAAISGIALVRCLLASSERQA
jgi:hypothetical protein